MQQEGGLGDWNDVIDKERAEPEKHKENMVDDEEENHMDANEPRCIYTMDDSNNQAHATGA